MDEKINNYWKYINRNRKEKMKMQNYKTIYRVKLSEIQEIRKIFMMTKKIFKIFIS